MALSILKKFNADYNDWVDAGILYAGFSIKQLAYLHISSHRFQNLYLPVNYRGCRQQK